MSIDLPSNNNLWTQAEKKVSDRCEACGHLLEVGYSTKHQAWLCREHFNHSNVEQMIFSQKVAGPYVADQTIVGGPAVSPFDNTWSEQVVKTAYHDNDAIDTNEQGGKQSHLEYRFDLIEPEFMLRMAHVLHTGALKYGERNWQSIPMDHNIGRAIYHLEMALQGLDHSEDHFANAACRVMFAMLTAHGVRYPSGKI